MVPQVVQYRPLYLRDGQRREADAIARIELVDRFQQAQDTYVKQVLLGLPGAVEPPADSANER